MTHARLHAVTGSLTVMVIILAALNWNYAPENANSWIAALIAMPLIWGFAGLTINRNKKRDISDAERKFFVSAVIFAGLLLAFSLAAKLTGYLTNIDPGLIERARGVFVGVVLLYFSNLAPKIIGPSLQEKCSTKVASAVRRFSGIILVLAAIGFIGAWIVAPLTQASNIATWILGLGVSLVILRYILARMGGR